MQINHCTKEVYNGQNQAMLTISKEENKFKSNERLTFIQARSKKLKIKKGSKGTTVFKGFGKIEEIDKDGKRKMRSTSNGYANVFNLDQTEALKTK